MDGVKVSGLSEGRPTSYGMAARLAVDLREILNGPQCCAVSAEPESPGFTAAVGWLIKSDGYTAWALLG